jgi:hypothetical protein
MDPAGRRGRHPWPVLPVARRRTIDIVHGPDPGPDTDVPTRALLTNLLTAGNVDTTATPH